MIWSAMMRMYVYRAAPSMRSCLRSMGTKLLAPHQEGPGGQPAEGRAGAGTGRRLDTEDGEGAEAEAEMETGTVAERPGKQTTGDRRQKMEGSRWRRARALGQTQSHTRAHSGTHTQRAAHAHTVRMVSTRMGARGATRHPPGHANAPC